MIKNEKQYRITKNELKKFKQTLDILSKTDNSNIHPLLVKAQRDSIESQIQEFNEDIEEYEKLKSGSIDSLTVSLFELSKGLISSRIAKGLNHKQLGELLGVSEQQIQKYESDNYQSTSLNRLQDVVNILDVSVNSTFKLVKGVDYMKKYRFLTPSGVDADDISNKIKNKGVTFSMCPR